MSDKLVRIKNRYDTAENWYKENPILAAGEIGIFNKKYIKIGDGVTDWNKLGFMTTNINVKTANIISTTELRDKSQPFSIGITKDMINEYEAYNDINNLNDLKLCITICIDGYYPKHIIYTKKTALTEVKFISYTDANQDNDSLLTLPISIENGSVSLDISSYMQDDPNIAGCYNVISDIYMSIEIIHIL